MTILETMARAIFAAHNADPDWDDGYVTPEQATACDDSDLSQQECLDMARAALEAAKAAGYVMVPVEPTEAMIDVGRDQLPEYGPMPEHARDVWSVMLASAPDVTKDVG